VDGAAIVAADEEPVIARELEEHVPLRRDHHPEVTGPASLLLLHEHARRVDA
jgi:hypothetical protein